MDSSSGSEEKKKSLSRKGSVSKRSFKLRSESLNSLRLRRVFDMFDKNSDNMITVDEIYQALTVLGLDADPTDLRTIVATFIKPGNDGLTYDDFKTLHESLSDTFFDCDDPHPETADEAADESPVADEEVMGAAEEEDEDQVESDLSEAFKVFDEDGDGFISAKELQQVLGKLGLPEAQQELRHIQDMISSVDQNSDGQVDFFEFKHMMLRSVLVPIA